MGQTAHQIEAHIDDTRENLGSNLHELEQKVKSVTDWKQHFRTNPMTMVGVAFGGGILIATMLGGRRNRRGQALSSHAISAEPHAAADHQKHKALEAWENVKGALIGVAATHFTDFVGEIVPGFHEQFQHMTEKTEASRTPMK
jgi:hypothetical protein